MVCRSLQTVREKQFMNIERWADVLRPEPTFRKSTFEPSANQKAAPTNKPDICPNPTCYAIDSFAGYSLEDAFENNANTVH